MKPRFLVVALLGLSLIQPDWIPAASAATSSTSRTAKTTKATAKQGAAKPAAKTRSAKRAETKKTARARTARKAVAAKGRPAGKQVAGKQRRAKTAVASRAAPVKVALRKAAAGATVASLATMPAVAAPTADDLEVQLGRDGMPQLGSSAFFVVNQRTGEVLLERNSGSVVPIASITKLMTAMVVLDAQQSLAEELVISTEDIDTLKGTGSRLGMGTRLSREEMLNLALMSSENRAASALARYYPGGERAFIDAMNVKARLLGLWNTRFYDSTGLTPANTSSPRDLAKLVSAAASYPLIRQYSTMPERYVETNGRSLRFGNTNSLVKSPDWQISVSKTGYISEAGRCLVMQAWMHQQPVVMVLMDSAGRYTRTADAQRVRKWLEAAPSQRLAAAPDGREG
jgi:D-alanyl-D-alanine endopeptidase (penicillin-binding protein 7)